MFAGYNAGEAFDGVPIECVIFENPAIFISSTVHVLVLCFTG